MPDSSPSTWRPPLGLSDAELDSIIADFAPLIRFNSTERHLPAQPEDFRSICRFRYSKPGNDEGWNRETRVWEPGNQFGAEFYNIPWGDILPASNALLTAKLKPSDPPQTNLRPRDEHNVFGRGSQTGLFLQRGENQRDTASGMSPAGGGIIRAPVFVDVVHCPVKRAVKLLYWFFYELNHWRFMITHEGDWEHITLIFSEDRFRDRQPPEYVYFAQHDNGLPINFDKLEIYEHTHCVIYALKDGHPCHAKVKNPASYNYLWRTWETGPVLVPRAVWRDFAGGWGEVGEFHFTTGPLGPWFKRDGDRVTMKVVDGKLNVVVR